VEKTFWAWGKKKKFIAPDPGLHKRQKNQAGWECGNSKSLNLKKKKAKPANRARKKQGGKREREKKLKPPRAGADQGPRGLIPQVKQRSSVGTKKRRED